MSVRLLLSGVIFCALELLSSRCLAAQFSWDAPTGCPDRDALRWRIEEALGTSLVQAAPLHFSAKVTEMSAKHWVVVLDVTSDGSETQQRRELEATTCDELAQTVSVAIALALGADPIAEKSEATETSPASSTEELATPKPKAVAEAPLTRAAVPKEKPENEPSYWFAAELGPSFDLGALPGLAAGGQVSAIGGWRGLGIKLGGVLFPDRSKQETGKPGGTFTLAAASLAVCGVAERPPTRVRFCAGSELGQLSGKGEN